MFPNPNERERATISIIFFITRWGYGDRCAVLMIVYNIEQKATGKFKSGDFFNKYLEPQNEIRPPIIGSRISEDKLVGVILRVTRFCAMRLSLGISLLPATRRRP